MITKKKAIVIGAILLLLLSVSIFAYQYDSSKAPIDLLDKFSNGIVFYYDNNTSQAAKTAIRELSDELNVNLLTLDINENKSIIDYYLDQNTDLVDKYNKIKDLELTLRKLRKSQCKVDEINFYYNKALNLVKGGVQENNAELQTLKNSILEFSTIEASQLNELLQLQQSPRIQVPLYSEKSNDYDNIPILKFVYNGNVSCRTIPAKAKKSHG